jgi:DNA polymerase I-like protein with 3'-5' exonuclease and polymerase domains
MTVPAILVDARNYDEHAPILKDAFSRSDFIGLDTETNDDRRHEGLNILCKYDDETRKKSKAGKLIFDFRRTDLCGTSFYTEALPNAYYLNLGHADVENRLTELQLVELMAAKKQGSFWVAHNAAFEMTVFKQCLGFSIDDDTICTLQQAVSAYGPHEFSKESWRGVGQGGIAKLLGPILRESFTGLTDPDKMTMSPELSDLVYKIIAKESDADHSYNGLVKSIAYGYGLKQLVKSWFGYEMTTFEEVLGDTAHMGQLTGEQVVAYGADDAYWAMRVFRHLLSYMLGTGGPNLVKTFFEQENPMVAEFSRIQCGGLKVNEQAIKARNETERVEAAKIFRGLKAAVRQLLPFKPEPDERLSKYDSKWYLGKNGDGYVKYRTAIENWATSDDFVDDYHQCQQVRGPVSNAWAEERKERLSNGPNFSHYMPVRTLIYDLINTKAIVKMGKVESDGEARGKLKDRLEQEYKAAPTDRLKAAIEVVSYLNQLAGVEQRMKLYIKPYLLLTDPETGRLYPTVTSMLATRRMAARDPNPMQLAKRGESTYVRGFFEADHDDHVIVSIDWSAIELVEIGEFSGDPEFIKAFSTTPHEDLHSGSASSILSIECPGLNEQTFKALPRLPAWEELKDVDNVARLATNLKGEPLDPGKAYKYWRTEVGKGANFNYWYSGWLATIGERMGWTPEKTAEATKAYQERFWVAEQWRLKQIEDIRRDGFVTLPDGHRYVRFEATQEWYIDWVGKFCGSRIAGSENYEKIMRWVASKIQKRAGNQSVNAMIQGSCATIAKRSVIRINRHFWNQNWTDREFRFLVPIHDELVFSVHKDLAPQFVREARGIMIDHPDMFKLCKLDASPALGRTFEPWDAKKAPLGQVELFEPPAAIVGDALANKRLDDDGIRLVVDKLFFEERRLAA